ncbi:MAG: SDR family oxidoreductase [Spirochaetia bacterium]|nr:SDR family oxidoreductase [Spirochaetia bacterium]
MYKFAFHNALITGGSSGIGLATAQKLVESGVNVMLVARDYERLGAAKRRLEERAAEGAEVLVVAVDVSDRKMLENVLAPLIMNGIPPDLVVNCAGMAYPNYFEQIDSEIFDKTVQINLTGTWNILKCVVPTMGPGGHIVNVSSVAGLVGTFGYTAYSASKFAVIGLSEALRNELSQKGIGVSVLCPADTDTPQLEFENRTKPPETRAISGNAGVMKPEQVAEALLAGVRKKRFLIVPGAQAKLVYLAKRLVPGLLYRIMDREAKKSLIVSHAAVRHAKRRK